MYKSVLGVALLASSCVCAANEFSVSLGYTKFSIQPNGFWYQEGYPYNLDTNSPSINIRYLFNDDSDKWQYGLQYTFIGKAKTWAMAVPSDSNYDYKNHTCFSPCLDLAEFKTRSTMQGISAIAKRNFKSYYLITGVMAGYSTNVVDVYGYSESVGGEKKDLHLINDTEVNYLPLLTLGKDIDKKTFIEVSLFPTTPKGGEYPAIFRNHSINVSIGYTF